MNCPYCKVSLMGGMTVCPKCKYDTATKDGGEKHVLWRLDHGKSSVEDCLNSFPQYSGAIEKWLGEKKNAPKEEEDEDSVFYPEQMEVFCTTTHSFIDAEIEKYLGIVTGTGVYLSGGVVGDGWLSVKQEKLFQKANSAAKERMLHNAYERGGNAVVGVQLSVSSNEVGNVIVVLTGTVVKIKKIEKGL